MKGKVTAIKKGVTLYDSELLRRRNENKKYLMELSSDDLLTHHQHEAGINFSFANFDYHKHGGWESPLCQLRGHFVGHWLSAAAMEYAATGDIELKAKADVIVNNLAVCQERNGGEWCAPIPEKYLDFIVQNRMIWAPQYTIHKTFMGLLDMYTMAGNKQALEIAVNFSKWFHRWSAQFDKEKFGQILDVETGGMLEIWAELYGITGDKIHRELMDKYYRHSLFDGLLEGNDVLTNMHANTTIPEALGAAKAYEVTGEQKWLDICKAYWDFAVTKRGFYATGGQTCGEVWTPMQSLSPRLGPKNQEYCTVYNMMRLADFLFRQTGDAEYADYWERNLYNGIMAQAYYKYELGGHGESSSHPDTGLIAYFLPFKGGSIKSWASKTQDFFCCHGTLVQSNTSHINGIYYHEDNNIYVCQFFDSDMNYTINGAEVNLSQRINHLAGDHHMRGSMTGSQKIGEMASQYANYPGVLRVDLNVSCKGNSKFSLKIRLPWWHKGNVALWINDKECLPDVIDNYLVVPNVVGNNKITFEFRKELSVCPLPDRPDTVAFLYGPLVLAGLCDRQTLTITDSSHPEQILVHENEREWTSWKETFRTIGQENDIDFIPLYKVGYEPYSVYFPVKQS